MGYKVRMHRVVLAYRINFLAAPFVIALAMATVTREHPGAWQAALAIQGVFILHELLSVAILFDANARKSPLCALSVCSLLCLGMVISPNLWFLRIPVALAALIVYPMNAASLYDAFVKTRRRHQVLGCGEHEGQAHEQPQLAATPFAHRAIAAAMITLVAAGSVIVTVRNALMIANQAQSAMYQEVPGELKLNEYHPVK